MELHHAQGVREDITRRWKKPDGICFCIEMDERDHISDYLDDIINIQFKLDRSHLSSSTYIIILSTSYPAVPAAGYCAADPFRLRMWRRLPHNTRLASVALTYLHGYQFTQQAFLHCYLYQS